MTDKAIEKEQKAKNIGGGGDFPEDRLHRRPKRFWNNMCSFRTRCGRI